MKHFINLKDIPASDLRKIILDAKKRKKKRKKLNTLEPDKGSPLKGKLLTRLITSKILLGKLERSWPYCKVPSHLYRAKMHL